MSRHNSSAAKAVALQYGSSDSAPVIVASGMGYLAEKIVETAQDSGVPIYEDNSLATILAQLKLGEEIPEELYQAIVEIYVYFLQFDPYKTDKKEDSASTSFTASAQEQPKKTAEFNSEQTAKEIAE